MMKRVLINLSNHPSEQWSVAQKDGWDCIMDVKFPNILPNSTKEEVDVLVEEYKNKIDILVENHKDSDVFIQVQGEFSFTCLFVARYHKVFKFVVPTTERIVVEKDGVKSSIFKFVMWRGING